MFDAFKSRVCAVRVPKSLALLTGAVMALAASAAPALADPPTLPAISFPIDTASVAAAVAAAGGLILIAYFGIKVGFALVKKLLARLHKSV